MFFFQDDIGILILLQKSTFWQFLFTPVSANFAPIMQLIYFLEYKLFALNFNGYVFISIMMHLINCIFLGKIVSLYTNRRFYIYLAVSFFFINLTYTEPFFWWASQGVLLSVNFVGLAFYFWYKFVQKHKKIHLYLSLLFCFLAGFTYGLGVGVGVLFALATIIYSLGAIIKSRSRIISLFTFVGLITYIIGPTIIPNYLSRVIPSLKNPFYDFIQFLSFVITGVSRGVVGRFFLPGFEPRHFETIPTIISFLPFFLVSIIFLKICMSKIKFRDKLLFLILIVFIFYPYIWAGLIRYQFGLKQALAERYAYPSIYFFIVLLVIMLKHLKEFKLFPKKNILALMSVFIFISQLTVFLKNTVLFEKRPLETKKYFTELTYILEKQKVVLDLPLPSYINQMYTISQLAPVIPVNNKTQFVKVDEHFCTDGFLKDLKDPRILTFYQVQAEDEVSGKVFSNIKLAECLYSPAEKNIIR